MMILGLWGFYSSFAKAQHTMLVEWLLVGDGLVVLDGLIGLVGEELFSSFSSGFKSSIASRFALHPVA